MQYHRIAKDPAAECSWFAPAVVMFGTGAPQNISGLFTAVLSYQIRPKKPMTSKPTVKGWELCVRCWRHKSGTVLIYSVSLNFNDMSEIRVCTLLWNCLLRQRRCISNTVILQQMCFRIILKKILGKLWNAHFPYLCPQSQTRENIGFIFRMFASLCKHICDSDLPTYTTFGIDV